MNLLRIVLLGLAAVVLVALGWRLGSLPHSSPPQGSSKPPVVAEQRPPPAMTPSAPALAPEAPAPVAPATSPPSARAALPAPPSPSAPPTPPAPAADATAAPAPEALTAEQARQKVDTVLQTAPALAQAFEVLKAQFPTVAERTFAEATETYRRSGTLPGPDDLFAKAMHDLRQSAGVLAAKAGPEALGKIFDEKAVLLADLEQADPRICADYLFGGTSPEFSDFLAGHRALVAQVALVDVEAMADGRTRQESWGKPSSDDFSWIEHELGKKGLSAEEISALLDGHSSDPQPPDARLCDNARTYLAVVKSMPGDARDRIYGLTAELLARS